MNTSLRHPDIKPAFGAAEVTEIMRRLNLTDDALVAALGFAQSAGRRRVRRWKDGEELPSGPALIALKLLFAIDRALGFIEDGEWERGTNLLRDAMPEFMR